MTPTIDTLTGAQLAVGFPGRQATPELIEHLRRLQIRTLVVFERNYESPEQFARLMSELHQALARPLLVMIDHEGGRVVRFRSGVTHFPAALHVGKTQTPEAVERQGAMEAEELRSLGVRANLAPCVDVLAEGGDPVIGDRSYGTNPEHVSAFAAARIRGLQSHGVAACAKHFPGLGAVPRDPHQMLSDIALDRETMERVHVAPFRAAIQAGVAMVMSSHVSYPAFGDPPGCPATFSPAIMRGLLRTTLGFHGLVLSDDLEMGAIRSGWTVGRAAVRAAQAGHDMLLFCSGDLAVQKEAVSALRNACRKGHLNEEGLQASLHRQQAVRDNFLR